MRLEDRQQTLERILPLVEKQDDLTRARVLGYIEGMAAANAAVKSYLDSSWSRDIDQCMYLITEKTKSDPNGGYISTPFLEAVA